MALSIRLLRPDDLIVLSVQAIGLDLDATDKTQPVLRPTAGAVDSLLIYQFQPQHITERAYFDADSQSVAPNEPVPGTTTEVPPPPGEVPARIAGGTRLVFRVPQDTAVPYSVVGLLDWSVLEPVLTPIAVWDPATSEDGAPEIAAPSANETAIELPYRLTLSPLSGHAWTHATQPVFAKSRAELWQTMLVANNTVGPPGPIPLRAVWSPDFRRLPLPMLDTSLDNRPFRTSLTPRERHQIVVLTSAFNGYEVAPGTAFQPSPILADRLSLSALGGWLFSRGAWQDHPYPADDRPKRQRYYQGVLREVMAGTRDKPQGRAAVPLEPEVKALLDHGMANSAAGLLLPGELDTSLAPRPDQLDVSAWDHQAAQGRDQYVRVVHEGFYYPVGHRCAVVTVTERRFEAASSGPQAGSPVAYLRQYAYIVRRELERSYADRPWATDRDRRALPFATLIRVDTAVTPHIEQPASSQIANTTFSFWVRVGGRNFPFHLTGRDITGTEIPFCGALIFVPLNEARMDLVQQAYAADTDGSHYSVPSQSVAYALPTSGATKDTALVTTGFSFDATGTIGDWMPRLTAADVHVPALEQLLGTSATAQITLFDGYLSGGIDVGPGVFADLRQSLPNGLAVGFSADRAGGIATPNLAVTGLSRAQGPVAGPLELAAAGVFEPAAFFPKGADQASIFGSIALADLIPRGNVGKNAPTINVVQDPPEPAPPRSLTTTIHWEPDVVPGTIAGLLMTDAETRLTIDGKLIRPLDGSSGGSQFSGQLTNFTLNIADVVLVHFDRFAYRTTTGGKPSVDIALRARAPVEFAGALSFVSTLASLIPADGFGGDGPSLDVSPAGLTIGYAIGLPPISIAVFALTDLRFAAGLQLPFLSGKPHLDFAFAERSHPFLLTVECLGGGGFLHLELDAGGIIMVDGALEFGGQFSLDIGVASGGVHVLAGIYFKLAGDSSKLAGFVDVGGEVSVLGLISISVDFNLTLAYFIKTNKAQGRATLVVAVHVALFSKSVDLSVERSFGGNGGDPTFRDVTTAADWKSYAAAFA